MAGPEDVLGLSMDQASFIDHIPSDPKDLHVGRGDYDDPRVQGAFAVEPLSEDEHLVASRRAVELGQQRGGITERNVGTLFAQAAGYAVRAVETSGGHAQRAY